jgi:hypothetical protein
VGKPEGRIMTGRTRHKWENNIKMAFKETGYKGVNWIDLAQDRNLPWALVNKVRNLRFLQKQMFVLIR